MIKIKTEDNVEMILRKDVQSMSELLNVLIVDYDMNEEGINGILSKELKVVIDFCELCEYKPIVLNKPLWRKAIAFHTSTFNERLLQFYKELSTEKILSYATLSDYYLIPSIDELIYLKLHDVFTFNDDTIIKQFFNIKGDGIDISVPSQEEKLLREKYQYYCKKGIALIPDDELNALCERYC